MKLEVIAKGQRYCLDPDGYEVIGELDREVVPTGISGKALVVHQLCKVKDEEMRFFILTTQDYATYDRKKVQVWPVSVEEAKRLAEDLVFSEYYDEIFGKDGK